MGEDRIFIGKYSRVGGMMFFRVGGMFQPVLSGYSYIFELAVDLNFTHEQFFKMIYILEVAIAIHNTHFIIFSHQRNTIHERIDDFLLFYVFALIDKRLISFTYFPYLLLVVVFDNIKISINSLFVVGLVVVSATHHNHVYLLIVWYNVATKTESVSLPF